MGTIEDQKMLAPYPDALIWDQSDKQSGRTSPSGTIYRDRGVRRYEEQFSSLPLKRFHQDGVHLHSDREQEITATTYSTQQQQQQQQQQHQQFRIYREHGEDRFSRIRKDDHYYHGQARTSRSRSRSRSRSPPNTRGRHRLSVE